MINWVSFVSGECTNSSFWDLKFYEIYLNFNKMNFEIQILKFKKIKNFKIIHKFRKINNLQNKN